MNKIKSRNDFKSTDMKSFISILKQEVDDEKLLLERVVLGPVDGYTLVEEFKYLEVKKDEWYRWSEARRVKYLQNLHDLVFDPVPSKQSFKPLGWHPV